MPRVCAFCHTNRARLTVEDVLPRWYLRQRPGVGLHTHEVWDGNGPPQRRNIPLRIQVRCVCSECNNGWMSAIQADALPFLERMIAGQPTDLDRDGQRAVASWVVMTMLTWQFALPTRPVGHTRPIPERIYRDFYAMSALRQPLGNTAVWIGYYSDQPRLATYYADVIPEIQPDQEAFNRIDVHRDYPPFAATLCLEHFVAQMGGHILPGPTLMRFRLGEAAKFWLSIWPTTLGLVSWPPQQTIDEQTLGQLERAFNPARSQWPSYHPE